MKSGLRLNLPSQILVIENHPDIAYNLYLTLKFNNYDVIMIKSWVKALDILHKGLKRPDLIVGDVSPSMKRIHGLKKIVTNDSWREIPFL
jgi:CheY-like chemotaxis protein